MEPLKKLFPTLAEWPSEKWMARSNLYHVAYACIRGILDASLGRI